jgi:hypothetical protein
MWPHERAETHIMGSYTSSRQYQYNPQYKPSRLTKPSVKLGNRETRNYSARATETLQVATAKTLNQHLLLGKHKRT